jgi:hypothetical protein
MNRNAGIPSLLSQTFRGVPVPFTALAVELFLGLSLLGGRNSPKPLIPQTEGTEIVAQQDPKPVTGPWYIQKPTVNPIDGVKTQIIRTNEIGSNVVLCFRNGRLCGVGVYISSPCWVDGGEEEGTLYKRRVRLRFDADQFLVETWNITDDHRAVFPRSPPTFIANLEKHKSLAFEFGCDRSDSYAETFDIHGLREAIESAGLTQP